MRLRWIRRGVPWPWIPLSLGLAALAFALGEVGFSESLRYERTAIADGQWWRLLSANLVHLGWAHLVFNLAGLGLIWLLVGGAYRPGAWGALVLVTSLATCLGLLAFNPDLEWYVGLSGMLHGMLVAGAIARVRQGHRDALPVLAIVAAKLLWEQIAGPLPGSGEAIGGRVIVDAHLYGALGGLLFALAAWGRMGRAGR